MPASPCSDPTSGLATSSSWQSSFLCQSSPCSSVEQQHEVSGAGMLTQLRLGPAPGGPRRPVSHPHSFSLSSLPCFMCKEAQAASSQVRSRLLTARLSGAQALQPARGPLFSGLDTRIGTPNVCLEPLTSQEGSLAG